jgi:GNAT superfamily N-acetyltransferase
MRIDYLADQPKLIGPLATGLLEHYRTLLPEENLQTRRAKLTAHLNRDRLPIAWVAHASGEALGTAALRIHDLPGREELTPWLGGMFTLPAHRGQGIGTALCAAVEAKAVALGVSMIYLVTLDRQGWYRRLGWRMLERCTWRGRSGDIMFKLLNPA